MKASWNEDICRRIAGIRMEMAGPRGKASFASQLGISPSTYDYYESDRVPPASVLVRIAEVAGVDLGWLLTGRMSGVGTAASHPMVQRAARLLGERPGAAAPLGAFMELLAQVQTLGEMQAVSPGEPFEKRSEVAAQVATKAAEEAEDARGGWVPILGRSAAGVPQFWASADESAGLTTLDDLLARRADHGRRTVRPAVLSEPSGESLAQIITLPFAGQDEPAEFVKAGAIKADYPDAFAVRIDGGSMSPDIAHGDVVVLSPSVSAADGRAAVVQLTGQIGVTCKLYRRDGQTVHLVPINEELPAVSVPAGEVVWSLRVLARVRPDTGQGGR